MYLSRRRRLLVLLAAGVVALAGCGTTSTTTGDDPGDLLDATTPADPPAASPSIDADGSEETAEDSDGDDDGDGDDDEERPVAAGDCAAYVDADGWCTDGIGDYDCEGGSGNGPNYAPRGVEVVELGTDPFGLDRNNDGEGCERSAPAEQPPPAPPPPPADETDPRFDTCGEAIDNGYGPYYRGQDPEYDWYRDADSDGVVCE